MFSTAIVSAVILGWFAGNAHSTVLNKRAVAGPVIDQDFPDPGLMRNGADGVWYAYSTSSGGKNIPVARSTDFSTWTIVGKSRLSIDTAIDDAHVACYTTGDALPDPGDWVDSSDSGLWAPDVREITSGYYVMYYSVKPTSVRAPTAHHIADRSSRNLLHHRLPIAALPQPHQARPRARSPRRAARCSATTARAA